MTCLLKKATSTTNLTKLASANLRDANSSSNLIQYWKTYILMVLVLLV